ncbi:MAG: hypothetical protein AB1478_06650 [Nitrospirota bacterium]
MAHASSIKDEILSRQTWLEESEFNGYREFLRYEDKDTGAFIRKATSTGKPVGTAEFIKRLEKILERDILPKKARRPKKEK